MSEYYFRTDTNRTHKITTVPFSINNLKFFCGSVDKEVQYTNVLQGCGTDGVSDSSINSDNNPLSPYSYNSVQDSNINKRITINNAQAKEVYYRTVFLVCKDITKGIGHNYSITRDLTQYFEIVTNINRANECKLLGNYNNEPTCTLCYDGNTTGGYTGSSELLKNADNTNNNYRVFAYHVYVKGQKTFIFRSSFHSTVRFPVSMPVLMYYRPNNLYLKNSSEKTLSVDSAGDSTTDNFVLYQYPLYDTTYKTFYEIDNNIGTAGHIVYNSLISGRPLRYNNYTGSSSTGTDISCWFSPNEIDLCFEYARYGMFFVYNGTCYKPIIENSIVKGYTTDRSAESDIDNWSNFNHSVPVPDDGEIRYDRIDDMPLGYTGTVNSFVRYYEISNTELSRLSIELSELQDGISHIISLKSFPVTVSDYCLLGSEGRIVINGDTDPPTVESQGKKVLALTYDKSIGSLYINGYYGSSSNPNFLDYAPYTKLEVYIPFCGFVDLPSSCMYQTINVYLLTDIIDGSATGVVKCNGQIVAQKTGIVGQSCALSVTDNATRDNAILQGLITATGQTLGLVTAGATGNVGAFANGALSIASTATNTIAGMNANYTRINGMNSGKVNNALPPKCYLIRYRPEKIETDNYAHTYGIPTDKKLSLTAGDGFTIVDNLNTDSITGATAGEREELKSFYRSGVIL